MPTIAELPSATDLNTADVVAIVQNTDGVSRKATLTVLGEFLSALGSGLGYTPINKAGDVFTGTPTFAGAANYSGAISFTGGGIKFGAQVGANSTDISKHIQLHSSGYGLGITGFRQNYVVPNGAAHYIIVNGIDVASFDSTSSVFGGSPNSSLLITPGATIANAPRISTNTTSASGIVIGTAVENSLTIKPGAASTNGITIGRTGTAGISFTSTVGINNGSGTDLTVGAVISLGTRVAAGSTATISTPNGSHINILPQGDGIVRIGSGIAPLEMGRMLQSVTWNPAAWSVGATPAYRQSMSLSGTLSSGGLNAVNQWVVNSDNMTQTGQALFHTGLFYNFGGASFTGNRGGLLLTMNQTGAVSGSGGAGGIEVLHVGVVTNNTFGGTNPGTGAAGAVFNSNIYGSIGASTVNLVGMVGMELDVEARTGATYHSYTGISVVSTTAHQQVGLTRTNYAYGIAGQTSSIGLDLGFHLSSWGLRSGSTLMRAYFAGDLPSFDMKRGFDLRVIDFTHDIFAAGQSAWGPTGRLRVGTGYIDIAANGMNLSVDGAVGTAGTLNASVTTTYAADGNHYWAEDDYGGQWKVTFLNGTTTITAVTMEVAPYVKGTPPANPLNLTPIGGLLKFVPIAPFQVNVTWDTTRNVLTLQPVGGATTVGGALTFGTASNNALIVTPGATSTDTVNITRSGSGVVWMPPTTFGAANQNRLIITPGLASTATVIDISQSGSGGIRIPNSPLTIIGNLLTAANFASPGSTITLSGTTVPTKIANFGVNWAGTSTRIDNTAIANVSIGSASDNAGFGSAAGGIAQLLIAANYGGANFGGGRMGMFTQLNWNTTSNITHSDMGLVGYGCVVSGSVNVGGVATGYGVNQFGKGSLFGGNPWARISGAATYYSQIVGYEVNVSMSAGSSAYAMTGLQVVLTDDHAVQADGTSVGIGIFAQDGATAGFENGFVISGYGGAPALDPNGTVMIAGSSLGSAPLAGAGGIDLLQFTASGNSPKTGGGFTFRSAGPSGVGATAIDATGGIRQGSGHIYADSSGLVISAPLYVLNGTPTIASGGTGWSGNDLFGDGLGNIFRVTAATGGVVTGIVVHARGAGRTDDPSGVIATKAMSRHGSQLGQGLTLTETWSQTVGAVSIATSGGRIGFFAATPVVKPTGVAVSAAGIHAALVSLGLIAA